MSSINYYKSAIYNLDHITQMSEKSNVELTLDYCKSSGNIKLINSSYHTNSCIVNHNGSSYMISPFSNITLPKLDKGSLLCKNLEILDNMDTFGLTTKYVIDHKNFCDTKFIKIVLNNNGVQTIHFLSLILTPSNLFICEIVKNKLILKKTLELDDGININRHLFIPKNTQDGLNYVCVIFTEGQNLVKVVDLRDFDSNIKLEKIDLNLYDNENNILLGFDMVYTYDDYLFVTQPKNSEGIHNGFNVYTFDFTNGIFPPYLKYQSSWYGSHVKFMSFKKYTNPNISGYIIHNNIPNLFLIYIINDKLDTSIENRKEYKTFNFNENDEENIYIVNLLDNDRDRELIKLDTVGINTQKYDDFSGFNSLHIDDNNNVFIRNDTSLYVTNIIFKTDVDKNLDDNINGYFALQTVNSDNFILLTNNFYNDFLLDNDEILVPNYTRGLEIFNFNNNNLTNIRTFDSFSYYESNETDKGSYIVDYIVINGLKLYMVLDLFGGIYLLSISNKNVTNTKYNKEYNSLQSSLIQNYILPKNISCYHYINNTFLHFDTTVLWYDDRLDLAILYYPSHVFSGREFPNLQIDNRINNEIFVTGMNSDNFINKTTLKGILCGKETTNIRLLSSNKYFGQVYDIYSSLISLSCDNFLGSMIIDNHMQCLGITRSSKNNLIRSIPSFNIKICIDKYLTSLNIATLNTNKDDSIGNVVNIDTNLKLYIKGGVVKNSTNQITNIEFLILENRESIYIYKESLSFLEDQTSLKNNSYYKVFGYENGVQIYLGVTQVIETNLVNWGKVMDTHEYKTVNSQGQEILEQSYTGYFIGRFANDLYSYYHKINQNTNLNIYSMKQYRFEELKVNTLNLENKVLNYAYKNLGKMIGISVCPVKQISKYLFRDIVIKNSFPDYFSSDVLEYYRNYVRTFNGYMVLDIDNSINPSTTLYNLLKGDIIVSINDNDDIDKISNIVYTFQGNNGDIIKIKYYRYDRETLRWIENESIIELANYTENNQNTFI